MMFPPHRLLLLTVAIFLPWAARAATTPGELTIDPTGGGIRSWKWHGKTLVDARSSPATLSRERADGTLETFTVRSIESGGRDATRWWELRGMTGPFPTRVSYSYHPASGRLKVRTRFEPGGPKAGATVQLAWKQPLALNPRKKTWFRGEHGIEWESRYFYQFMFDTTGRLLSEPDCNEWRSFGLDQLGTGAFRLWKRESASTSPLIMQEGRRATPAVQCFDETGGVTVEIPRLDRLRAARLLVEAEGSGALQLAYHSRHGLAAAPNDPALHGVDHEIILQAGASPDALLKHRAALVQRHPSPPFPDQQVLTEEPWLVNEPLHRGQPLHVTGGYPFAKGQLHDSDRVAVHQNGQRLPLQAKTLAYWPDGSIKWVLLTFPVDPEAAQTEGAEPPRVSLRNGRFIPLKISVNPDGEPAPVSEPVTVREEKDGSLRLATDSLEAVFGTGETWLRSLTLDGEELLNQDASTRLAWCDFRTDPPLPFERHLPKAASDRGTLRVERIAVEERGPLRAVIRLEGLTTNREPTRIILRITAQAGRSELAITHTAQFRFHDPRTHFLNSLGLALPLKAGSGVYAGSPSLTPEAEGGVTLLQSTPFHTGQVLRRGDGSKVAAHAEETRPWLHKPLRHGSVTASLRHFRKQAPKALAWDAAHGELRVELWPRDAAPMDVRRYSNYPHRSQGESTGGQPTGSYRNWAAKVYYPSGPLYGLSRTHELLLSFASPVKEATSLAADFQSPPLLYAGWDRYEQTGVVLPAASKEGWPHLWKGWTNLASFWLWHQANYAWYGFWNFGDVRHRFRDGYGWVLPPQKLEEALRQPQESQPKLPRTKLVSDYHTPNDWSYDNGRWGWSNTEGLPNLFLQHEYLRHGNRAIYFATEALARHSRDVVTRHEGPFLGKGTRHGVQHWSDGNHEERQTTVTEYRLHYLLSGDPRSRDVIENLYSKVYSRTAVGPRSAGHSGRLGGLLFHWEITGDPREAKELEAYINLFLSPRGIYGSPHVAFPQPRAIAPPAGLNTGGMFFHTFGAMHALVEYHHLTGHPGLKQALIKMADAMLADAAVRKAIAHGGRGSRIFWPQMAFAALHADRPAPYREALATFVREGGWKELYQTVSANPGHWSGPGGFLRRNVTGSFFFTNWSGYLGAGVGGREVWDDTIATKFAETEKNGIPQERTGSRWQSAYDNFPRLEAYLRQPWLKPPSPLPSPSP